MFQNISTADVKQCHWIVTMWMKYSVGTEINGYVYSQHKNMYFVNLKTSNSENNTFQMGGKKYFQAFLCLKVKHLPKLENKHL